MTESKNGQAPSAAVSLARQPVFDDNRRLWGYELFCVGEALAAPNDACPPGGAATSLAAGAAIGLQRIVGQGQNIILNLDEMGLLANLPYALPPMSTVVQIDEGVFLRPSMADGLARLKSDGYLIAVRGFSGDRRFQALYDLADIIGIPVIGRSDDAIAALLSAIRGVNARLLARRVDDAADFDRCRSAGITLFQGAFFKQPDTITVRRLTSNAASRLKLLQRIEMPQGDMDDLVQTIQSDAAVSYRLLAYLNSAAFAFPQKIRSVPHAVQMLGWNKLKVWLRVVLINDMRQAPHAPELLQLSAQRGKFLELVARSHDYWGFDPESLHLLGLFSLLDAILGAPMGDIVALLPIEEKLKGALRREAGNEYLPLVQLAQCVEEARWADAEAMMQRLNLNRERVTIAFRDAVAWADQVTMMQAHTGVS